MLTYLFWIALSGLVIGALGRLAIPGPDPMGIGMTILIGIGGSLIAGLIARWIWGPRYTPGILLAVGASALLVWLYRRSRRRTYA